MRQGQVAAGHRSETAHRSNLSNIVTSLHARGALSRSELGAVTGLTRSAIRTLVGELAAGGLVIEEPGLPSGSPGRPSPVVRLVPQAVVVVACQVLVDTASAAVVGLDGTVLALERVPLHRDDRTVERVVATLGEVVGRLLADIPTTPVGIGVAIAGVVRRADGVVRLAPNLDWRDAPLGAPLAAALGLDVPVVVANEADAGALAEHRRGAAVGVDDLLYVSGEVGVGGGIITGGRPLEGADGYGGEIGHLPVNPAGAVCRCGSTGCWETEVGEATLLTRAGLPGASGREGVETVLARAGGGDEAACAALAHVGRWLGIGLVGLVNVGNPRLVVLGSMHGRIHDAVRADIERELQRTALPAAREVRVVAARLGQDAPLLGAAELALDPVLADPAAFLATPVGRSAGGQGRGNSGASAG